MHREGPVRVLSKLDPIDEMVAPAGGSLDVFDIDRKDLRAVRQSLEGLGNRAGDSLRLLVAMGMCRIVQGGVDAPDRQEIG